MPAPSSPSASFTVTAPDTINTSMFVIQLGISLQECAVEPAVFLLTTTQRKVSVRVGLGGGAVVTEALKLRLEEIPGVESVEVGRWELPAGEPPAFVD